MKKLMSFVIVGLFLGTLAYAQPMRMVVSAGGNSTFTIGQSFVGYSSGSPNNLWQGFWIPRNITTSVESQTKITDANNKIYPNPATDYINVLCENEISTIKIYSNVGNVVYVGTIPHVDIQTFPQGRYSVLVKDIHGNNFIHSFVVVR